VLAFLTDEGSFVYAPVTAPLRIFARLWRTSPRGGGARLPFVCGRRLVRVLVAFPNPQLKFDGYYWGSHVFTNYGVYLSFIAFPSHAIPLTPDAMRWAIAGALLAVSAIVAVRGPNIARLCVGGMLLAILPYAPVSIWTASRYTYTAVAFFALVAAIGTYAVYDRVRNAHQLLRVPATIVGLLFVASVAGLYGWQTYAQDKHSGENTARWQLLVDELKANYETVPAARRSTSSMGRGPTRWSSTRGCPPSRGRPLATPRRSTCRAMPTWPTRRARSARCSWSGPPAACAPSRRSRY
jgi:hypothetical protein